MGEETTVGLSSYEMQWRGALPSGDRRVRVITERQRFTSFCALHGVQKTQSSFGGGGEREGGTVPSSGAEGWFWCR